LEGYLFPETYHLIKEMAPPPPVEIKVNDQGVQELTLVVTPGGYSPLRFAVKKGVLSLLSGTCREQLTCSFPVRLHGKRGIGR
jgi:plastocyanin domain-containing protein